MTSTIKSIFLFGVKTFFKAYFIASFTVLCTEVNDFVLLSRRVAPTASDIWMATSWATFFYMSFCLKSVRTSVRSSFVICLSPTTFLNFPTHLLRKESFLSSSSLSSSLSKKPAIFYYFSSSKYFYWALRGDLLRRVDRSRESMTFLSTLWSNDSRGFLELSYCAYYFFGLFDLLFFICWALRNF